MRQSVFSFCAVCALWPLLAVAVAQEAQPTDSSSSEQASPPRSGLIDELGKLLKSPADLLPKLDAAKSDPKADAPKPDGAPSAAAPADPPPPAPSQAAAPTPPAAEAPAAPSTRFFPGMVTGREICPRSANGAPDCQTGTDNLCKSKGYKSGKSLNTDSAFTCSARQARVEGRKPCGTEHYVTSAFCQ